MGSHRLRAHGLNVRAVVTQTYVQVDGEPWGQAASEDANGNSIPERISTDIEQRPVAVYCDVITYGSSEGFRFQPMRRVPVFTDSGMHEGRVWVPRASTQDVEERELDLNLSNLSDLDGDHVLIQFLEDDLTQPFISRRIPHPKMGHRNDERDLPGHRMRLQKADGNPDFHKHRGVYYGVDTLGNFIVDTTRAHEGKYNADGSEVPLNDAGHGRVRLVINSASQLEIVGVDENGENEQFALVLKDNLLQFRDGGLAGYHPIIYEHMATMWTLVKTWMETHVHPDGMGGTGPSGTGVAWDPNADMEATKVDIPDG